MRVVITSYVPPSTWDIEEHTYTETSTTVSVSLYWRWWGLSSFHVSLHQPDTYRSTPILRPPQLLVSVSTDVDGVDIISCVSPSTWNIQEHTYTETSTTVSFSLYWHWWVLSSFHVSLHQPETYRSTPILRPPQLLVSVSIDIDEGCHHFMCPSINLKSLVHFLTPRPKHW